MATKSRTVPTPVRDLQFWNAMALVLFIVLAGLALWLIDRFGTLPEFNVLDFSIMALATFRLAHLFTNDKIFDFVRVLVFDRHGSQLTKAERGWRRLACEMFECLWCAGLWSALIVVAVYPLGLWGMLVDILLAVAGAAALLQLVGKALAARV